MLDAPSEAFDAAEEALASGINARKVRPSWRPLYETLACCRVLLGRLPEARSYVEQMRGIEDQVTPRNPQWAEELANLLKKAGWPQGTF